MKAHSSTPKTLEEILPKLLLIFKKVNNMISHCKDISSHDQQKEKLYIITCNL